MQKLNRKTLILAKPAMLKLIGKILLLSVLHEANHAEVGSKDLITSKGPCKASHAEVESKDLRLYIVYLSPVRRRISFLSSNSQDVFIVHRCCGKITLR